MLVPLTLSKATVTFDEVGAATKTVTDIPITGRITSVTPSESREAGREAAVGDGTLGTNSSQVGALDRITNGEGVWEVQGDPYRVPDYHGGTAYFRASLRRVDG